MGGTRRECRGIIVHATTPIAQAGTEHERHHHRHHHASGDKTRAPSYCQSHSRPQRCACGGRDDSTSLSSQQQQHTILHPPPPTCKIVVHPLRIEERLLMRRQQPLSDEGDSPATRRMGHFIKSVEPCNCSTSSAMIEVASGQKKQSFLVIRGEKSGLHVTMVPIETWPSLCLCNVYFCFAACSLLLDCFYGPVF